MVNNFALQSLVACLWHCLVQIMWSKELHQSKIKMVYLVLRLKNNYEIIILDIFFILFFLPTYAQVIAPVPFRKAVMV